MLAVLLFVVVDAGSELAGNSLFPGAPLDETAHLLTTLLVVWALGGRACERFLIPALVASVAIDADHLPGRFGADWLTAGTPRPYTHSLLTVAVVLAASIVWARRRDLLLGVALGLTLHLWRDMAESGNGVSLLWPVSRHAWTFRHGAYLVIIAVVVAVDAIRLLVQRLRVATIEERDAPKVQAPTPRFGSVAPEPERPAGVAG
jgi:inner membrane protein